MKPLYTCLNEKNSQAIFPFLMSKCVVLQEMYMKGKFLMCKQQETEIVEQLWRDQFEFFCVSMCMYICMSSVASDYIQHGTKV